MKVWATRGFDPDLIEAEAEPEDKKIVKQLGLCYRANIDSTAANSTSGWNTAEVTKRCRDTGEPAPKHPRKETPDEQKARVAEEKLKSKLGFALIRIKARELGKLQDQVIDPLNSLFAHIHGSMHAPFAHLAVTDDP